MREQARAEYLMAAGFRNVRVTSGGADGGIDLIGVGVRGQVRFWARSGALADGADLNALSAPFGAGDASPRMLGTACLILPAVSVFREGAARWTTGE